MYIHFFAGGCWRVKDAQPGLLAKLLTIAQGGTAAQGGQGTPAAQLQVADLLGPTGTSSGRPCWPTQQSKTPSAPHSKSSAGRKQTCCSPQEVPGHTSLAPSPSPATEASDTGGNSTSMSLQPSAWQQGASTQAAV